MAYLLLLELLLFLAAQCAFSENPLGLLQLIFLFLALLHFLFPGALVICLLMLPRDIVMVKSFLLLLHLLSTHLVPKVLHQDS